MKHPAWSPTRSLTVYGAGTKVDPPGETFGPRTQWSWEFVWVRAGSAEVSVNGERFRGGAGTLVLVPPGARDSYRWSPREKTIHSFLHFKIKRLPPSWPPPSRWPRVRRLPPDHILLRLFAQVLALTPLGEERYRPVLGPTVELMLRYFLCGESGREEPPLEPGLSPAVEKALQWMKDRVREKPLGKIRLPEMARVAAVSPQYLCRLFRRELQVKPMECARLLKAEYGGVLLERSRLTVKEIAVLCGFENPFHFSRVFKEVYGIPPKAYREGFRGKRLVRPPSPIFRKQGFQRVLFNRLVMPLDASFRMMPKKYRSRFIR